MRAQVPQVVGSTVANDLSFVSTGKNARPDDPFAAPASRARSSARGAPLHDHQTPSGRGRIRHEMSRCNDSGTSGMSLLAHVVSCSSLQALSDLRSFTPLVLDVNSDPQLVRKPENEQTTMAGITHRPRTAEVTRAQDSAENPLPEESTVRVLSAKGMASVRP